jgi:hypothetical protein
MQHGQCYLFLQMIAVLSFSCSCFVSSSPSEVGQFNFECCPLVQEISSATHYLPCFGGGLSPYLFTESPVLEFYFFALPPFSGSGCIPPTLSMVHVLLQFTACFSDLGGSSVLNAAI